MKIGKQTCDEIYTLSKLLKQAAHKPGCPRWDDHPTIPSTEEFYEDEITERDLLQSPCGQGITPFRSYVWFLGERVQNLAFMLDWSGVTPEEIEECHLLIHTFLQALLAMEERLQDERTIKVLSILKKVSTILGALKQLEAAKSILHEHEELDAKYSNLISSIFSSQEKREEISYFLVRGWDMIENYKRYAREPTERERRQFRLAGENMFDRKRAEETLSRLKKHLGLSERKKGGEQ